ncbi:MAG: hypothetical protein PHF53_10495 [Bacteroidales bacterium]|jgi:chromosome segregation ATPase|nr:hypothetical protein [Bacteroidales bacterium]
MPWTCEYCGCENLQDDRVGRREPQCVRCNHQRGERTAKIKTLEFAIGRIKVWDREHAEKIERLTSQYEDTWAELDRIAAERESVRKERHENSLDLQAKQERLAALQALDPTARRVAEDQSTLQGVRV